MFWYSSWYRFTAPLVWRAMSNCCLTCSGATTNIKTHHLSLTFSLSHSLSLTLSLSLSHSLSLTHSLSLSILATQHRMGQCSIRDCVSIAIRSRSSGDDEWWWWWWWRWWSWSWSNIELIWRIDWWIWTTILFYVFALFQLCFVPNEKFGDTRCTRQMQTETQNFAKSWYLNILLYF